MNVDVSPSPPIQGIVDSLGGYATVDASGRYGSVCRVDLGDPVMVSERDQERSALGPDLLKYERKELLRVSKRIKVGLPRSLVGLREVGYALRRRVPAGPSSWRCARVQRQRRRWQHRNSR